LLPPPLSFPFFEARGIYTTTLLQRGEAAIATLTSNFPQSISPYVGRYGYKDLHKKDDDFEKKLFHSLSVFVRLESMMEGCTDSEEYSVYGQETLQSIAELNHTSESGDSIVPFDSTTGQSSVLMRSIREASNQTEVDELEFLVSCRDVGVVHIMGNTMVRARRDSRFYKKIAVDYIYAFLRKICRENSVIFNVPHESLLNVEQIFYV